MTKFKHTNALINEHSPYLLQHAHNPVNWYAWNNETLKKAREENKLILVSVGYSACHWCHVMEHESFEDEGVAEVMNKYFVCIKVDREERPDIDQVYMSAVQIMTGHGGWPLNCFALPDGRPIYGGTYFPKEQWTNVLLNLARLWKEEPDKAETYAADLVNGMQHVEAVEKNNEEYDFSISILKQCVKNWKGKMDTERGGPNRAPKFPMPNNWLFLLRYAHFSNEKDTLQQVLKTLDCMADGGIYDHAGGGFARYSTDMDWKVPHFEKMLYDNAQLISLYAEAYTATGKTLYKEVAYECIEFVYRELYAKEGGFYSALDADSEGKEGKFYTWEKDELEKIIPADDFKIFCDVFSVNEKGYWEDEQYILLRSVPLHEIAMQHSLSEEALNKKIQEWKKLVLQARSVRTRPGLDDKILAAWNALMIKALCDSYLAFGDHDLKEKAIAAMEFFMEKFYSNKNLKHAYKSGQAYINAFLDDYAFVVDALISVFLICGNEKYIELAEELTNHCYELFYDKKSGMFWFTSATDEQLVIRKTEISDNVIPASCSQMARNLFTLYRITNNRHYRETAFTMLNNVKHEIGPYGSGYSNWSLLLLELLQDNREVAIVGKNVDEKFSGFLQNYLPYTIFALSSRKSDHPLFKNRYVEGKTLLYVCRNNTCQLPVETAEEALGRFKQ